MLAFLELHPGSHNLKELEDAVKEASAAARSLARKRILVSLRRSRWRSRSGPMRAPHELNAAQEAAFEQIARGHPGGRSSRRFCCTA